MEHSLRQAARAALCSLVAVACSETDSDTAESTTTTAVESSTTESATPESSTTTATPRPDADEATRVLAEAGVLQTADFGEAWSEYRAGGAWEPTEESCGHRVTGPEDSLLTGAAQRGPTVQRGELPAYVSSRSFAFPSEAEAVAWIEIAKSDGWAECHRLALQEFGDERDTEVTATLVTREREALGEGGLEAYAEFGLVDADGETEFAQYISVSRVGRVVVVEWFEVGFLEDADWTAANDEKYDALSAAYDRLNSLQDPGDG